MTAELRNNKPAWILILILLGALLIINLTSCSNEFYCSKCVTHTVEKTVIHDTTIIRDTVIKIEERTLTIRDTVPCDDFELNKDSNGVKVNVLVKDKIIYVKATCAALELKLRMYDKVRTITKTTELTRFVNKKRPFPWWFGILCFVLGIAICNIKRIIKFILTIAKPL